MNTSEISHLRYAVTGAGGFVGSHLCSRLIEYGAHVKGLGRSNQPSWARHIPWIRGDVTDSSALETLTKDVDIVFHLAARVHVRMRPSTNADSEFERVNVEGTQKVLHASKQSLTRPFVVFVSTVGVAGQSDASIDEKTPCAPATPYARSKLAAEHEVQRSVESNANTGCIVRPTSMFGDRAPGNLKLLASCIQKGFLPLVDGGHNKKSLMHVSTLIDALLLVALKREHANGETWIVTDNEPYSMHDIGAWVAAAVHRTPLRIHIPSSMAMRGAGALDRTFSALSIRAPLLTPIVRTFSSSSVFSNMKIRSLLGFEVRKPTPLTLPNTLFD